MGQVVAAVGGAPDQETVDAVGASNPDNDAVGASGPDNDAVGASDPDNDHAPPAARREFARFLGLRLASGLLVIWAAVTLVFFVFRALPGSSNLQLLLGVRALNAEQVATARAELGLDQPLIVQYFGYLGDLLRGDLGTSYLQGKAVAELIAAPLLSTLQLTLAALGAAWLISILFTLLTSGRSALVEGPAQVWEVVAASLPQFWLGLMLLVVFAINLHWFPVSAGDTLHGMVLPTLALAIPLAGLLGQLSRQSFEEALEQPFVLSARARGLSDWSVRWRHVLRHSLAPALALSGQATGWLIGGALIIEEIFARPGLGRSVFQAVSTRDLPVILGVIVSIAVGYVIVNIVVDVLQRAIDPRIG